MDNTTNILRLMLLLSLAIGVVLTRTLLQGKRTRWQQSPFLLTANKPVEDEDDEKKKSIMSTLRLLLSDSYDPWFNGGRGVHFPPDARHPAGAVPVAQCRYRGHRPRAEPVEGV